MDVMICRRLLAVAFFFSFFLSFSERKLACPWWHFCSTSFAKALLQIQSLSDNLAECASVLETLVEKTVRSESTWIFAKQGSVFFGLHVTVFFVLFNEEHIWKETIAFSFSASWISNPWVICVGPVPDQNGLSEDVTIFLSWWIVHSRTVNTPVDVLHVAVLGLDRDRCRGAVTEAVDWSDNFSTICQVRQSHLPLSSEDSWAIVISKGLNQELFLSRWILQFLSSDYLTKQFLQALRLSNFPLN